MKAVFASFGLFVAIGALAAAEPQPGETEGRRQEAVAHLARAKARMFDVFVGEMPVKADLHPDPLLRWSNPTAGSVYGEVFLWTIEKRPAAVASIYRWYHPFTDSTVEIVSVSDRPIVAKEGNDVRWESLSAGVRFQPVPQAPQPGESRGVRLSQMRTLARRFSAELSDERGGEQISRELRLLNQPVYRYDSKSASVVDGALFAFVEVTDPEAWLLIEAVADGETISYRYALARMNADAVQVRCDGSPVESWPKIHQPWRYRKAPYTLFGFDPNLVTTEAPQAAPE